MTEKVWLQSIQQEIPHELSIAENACATIFNRCLQSKSRQKWQFILWGKN